ncbi:chlamydia polymorphic membrane middle domain protein, partial [Chlamydia psittaci 09DC78]
QSKLSI